ncbi:hypothetical protein AADZ91_07290 [Colwelliaceae bacterium 6441]
MPKIVITAENIIDIVHLIDTWKGKLTWPLLCKEVIKMLELDSVTRQALSSYEIIQKAFTARQRALREEVQDDSKQNSDVEYLNNQILSLEAELNRAEMKIEAYEQRFILWQYNAYQNGIRMETLDDAIDMLEQPLIEIKRKTGGA